MDKKLKLAVIGAGGIARVAHLPAYKNMDNVELVAICDIIEERAKEKAEEYNVKIEVNDAAIEALKAPESEEAVTE